MANQLKKHPKVFVVGFNKCGTSSFQAFFERSGLESIHWDRGRLAPRVLDNIRAGRPPLAGYDKYEAFCNTDYQCEHVRIEIAKYFRTLMAEYPDLKFVLNVRDVERWIASRMMQGNVYRNDESAAELGNGTDRPCPRSLEGCNARAGYAENYRRYYGLADMEQVAMHMRSQWHAHVSAVQRDIPGERLLVFNIEQDDPAVLCDFLGFPAEYAEHWGQFNPTISPGVKRVIGLIPGPIKAHTPVGVKNVAKSLVSGVRRYRR